MDLISFGLGVAAGIVTGCMCYRYLLKRDPDKLERWAAVAKSTGKKAGF
jgi:hypothetical protein